MPGGGAVEGDFPGRGRANRVGFETAAGGDVEDGNFFKWQDAGRFEQVRAQPTTALVMQIALRDGAAVQFGRK